MTITEEQIEIHCENCIKCRILYLTDIKTMRALCIEAEGEYNISSNVSKFTRAGLYLTFLSELIEKCNIKTGGKT